MSRPSHGFFTRLIRSLRYGDEFWISGAANYRALRLAATRMGSPVAFYSHGKGYWRLSMPSNGVLEGSKPVKGKGT